MNYRSYSVGGMVLYRLPYADHYIEIKQTKGEIEELHSPAELRGKSGFVFAPFAVSDDCPILLIRNDNKRIKRLEIGRSGDVLVAAEHKCEQKEQDFLTPSKTYAETFEKYHSRLLSGEFQKIVLARTADEETGEAIDPRTLFERACLLYPRMFVALVSTPKSGTWLAATPEILLEGHGNEWRTMALAGTMKLSGDQLLLDNPPRQGFHADDIAWNAKNMEEQRIVAAYIEEQLRKFTNDISEDGPYTVRAGNLVHLRSDFRFTLDEPSRIGELIDTLHPTPAVCGLPKEKTQQFIIDNEPEPRRYYSGFMGPLQADGDTHLYVSLRCMETAGQRHKLYAGGGLLADSTEESEWRETEAKMETMRQCLQTRKTSTF